MTSPNSELLLVGAGGHARSCIDVIEMEGSFRIQGLVGVADEIGERVLDYPVLCSDDSLAGLDLEGLSALVTIGQISTPEHRIRLFQLIKDHGLQTPALVSPLAHVSRHARIGEGTIVMHGAIVNAGASVGRNCIINSKALVEHDSRIEDHCHISTNAAINSTVSVGSGSFVGSGVTVRQGVRIGEKCVVGMGQRVLHDCPPATLYLGDRPR